MKPLKTLLAEIEKEFDELYEKSKDYFRGRMTPQDKAFAKSFYRSQIKKVLKEVGEDLPKELKKSFEANLLDGDKVEDCGKASLDAKYVWEWLDEELRKKLSEMMGGENDGHRLKLP